MLLPPVTKCAFDSYYTVFFSNVCFCLSQWTILFGRLVSGLGIGLEGAVLGLVSKSTAKTEDKPKVIAGLLLMKQMGIIIGHVGDG